MVNGECGVGGPGQPISGRASCQHLEVQSDGLFHLQPHAEDGQKLGRLVFFSMPREGARWAATPRARQAITWTRQGPRTASHSLPTYVEQVLTDNCEQRLETSSATPHTTAHGPRPTAELSSPSSARPSTLDRGLAIAPTGQRTGRAPRGIAGGLITAPHLSHVLRTIQRKRPWVVSCIMYSHTQQSTLLMGPLQQRVASAWHGTWGQAPGPGASGTCIELFPASLRRREDADALPPSPTRV